MTERMAIAGTPSRATTEGRNLVRVTVDGIATAVAPGTTVLEAARHVGHEIPTLCFDERQAPFGACRVCLVGVDGPAGVTTIPACTTLCRDGMAIETRDPRARRIAANVVELVLSELPEAPAAHTELAAVAEHFGIGELRWTGDVHEPRDEPGHPYLALRHELCISCGRCVRACDEVQGAFALTATGRGFEANVAAGLGSGFRESSCVSCGACADTCPTDAITEVKLLNLLEARI
jgi:bidirectional [NiFe] hydrogenase diaphorase subunit